MAVYAALVSLMHIIHRIQLHPRPPISLDKKQAQSLTENATFLQAFLERYSHVDSKEADDLESRIADAAYAAEDVIESHIVDRILAGSTSDRVEKISSVDLYEGLERVIDDMDFIKKEAMEIKEKMGVHDQLHRCSSMAAAGGSLRSASTGQDRTKMVGFDDVVVEVMDKLIGGQPGRQIISIVGMGGSGKTTLAQKIYEHQVVVQYFDILAWVTISQEYSVSEILVEILQEGGENVSLAGEGKLGEKLHKKLSGRRYLIILDDIWDIEVCYLLNRFFPDNKNGSRVIVTTRLSKLAFQLTGSRGLEMNFLDEFTSWDLLCRIVFGKGDCPNELADMGKEIIRNCKGLPLSIVTIGGILAKSEQTRLYWKHIAENLNSIVNLDNNERCLQILYMSYNELPIHLKPCFLYMSVFLEDSRIRAPTLIKLWVAEGFLKPVDNKSLEEVAESYLEELVDRNLILVHQYSSRGRIKYCKIHDLLRDLCIREARRKRFLYVLKMQNFDISKDINTKRRICIHKSSTSQTQILHSFETASLARSLVCESPGPSPSFSSRLLRVASGVYKESYKTCSLEPCFQQVNLRYLDVRAAWAPLSRFPSSVDLLWNLETLIIHSFISTVTAPSEIWKMRQLKHVQIKSLELPDPPSVGQDDDVVLENLQTLLLVKNFTCGEEVVKRIPSIKKLKISYQQFEDGSYKYCLNNLGHLHKLETLGCLFYSVDMPRHLVQSLTFPHSLKKLSLYGTQLEWEEMTTKIGSLPLLEVLKLKNFSCIGPSWETVEGQFCSLKFLQIEQCYDLEYWTTTDSTHFPCLEHLLLQYLYRLKEIPSSIGDIPTLQSIQLEYCSDSAADSAKAIQDEQEEFGNVGLRIRVLMATD